MVIFISAVDIGGYSAWVSSGDKLLILATRRYSFTNRN